jgi:sialate O-acetylesterase
MTFPLRTALQAVLALCVLTSLQADVKLPKLISDHMVLQQDMPVRIWGHASAGEAVNVEFNSQQLSTKAGEDGKWEIRLSPMKAGGPFSMTIAGENTLTIQDILVGEVWLGSGEVNMEFPLEKDDKAQTEIAHADYPKIRFFEVGQFISDQPLEDVDGRWVSCSPAAARKVSAIGYYFSREIYKTRQVPVGFINASMGNRTQVRAFVSHAALEKDPKLKGVLTRWQDSIQDYPAKKAQFDKRLAEWKQAHPFNKGKGQKGQRPPQAPPGPGSPNTPCGVYNAMISPLTPYAIRGVAWYQGEGNVGIGQTLQYRRLLETVIEDWRKAWGEGSFPFLLVQLPIYTPDNEAGWLEVRESQLKALEVTNTALAVTLDLGDPDEVMPKNKEEFGHRLALAARATVYGEKLAYSGPVFRGGTPEGNRFRIKFDHIGGGLKARGGGKLTGFTIAGADRRFVPAETKINGDAVLVSSPEVKQPQAVRYAWAANPVCNLINKEDLPAAPFRTDDWEEEK